MSQKPLRGPTPCHPAVLYGLALLLTALTVLIRQLLMPILGTEAPLLLFVIPVYVSASYAGLEPWLLATVVGAVAGTYFFIEPLFSFRASTIADAVRIAICTGEGIAISLLPARLGSARTNSLDRDRELKASEDRFRLLLGTVRDYAIFMLSPSGHGSTFMVTSPDITTAAHERGSPPQISTEKLPSGRE